MTSQPAGAPDLHAGVESLRRGETPFAYVEPGLYGYLDLDVFGDHNDTRWCDITGTLHLVTDMTPDYRHNVLAILERNAAYFHLMVIRRRLLELSSDLAHCRVDPADLQRLHSLLELDPVTWITTTPGAKAVKHPARPQPLTARP